MVVLPLMLPPLPPPPLILLFFPVGIMAALMFLALSPSDAAANGALYTCEFCDDKGCPGLFLQSLIQQLHHHHLAVRTEDGYRTSSSENKEP
ncbi:hypothetical protein NC653_000443 [Populus alba x Populus x berolinensis]|uniref:Uncharacterized protein n=1 Tax=Populus alba x Populus x berolinensis TaxID=444605 RepID=A0AAD6RJ27_9ROSI|nr:hypothetical protein NC653_000443 [Populus alba x Populus x berolinensis]